MKKIKSLFCLFIIAALALAACSLSGGDDGDAPPPPPGVTDDPQSGSMSAATATGIFDYSETAQGVTIEKFKDAGALENYLDSGAKALANTKFIIGTINGRPVVKIADNAFDDSQPGVPSLPADLSSIKLPETLREIGSGAFNITVSINLLIPAVVFDILVQDDPVILQELDTVVTIKAVTDTDPEGESTPPPVIPSGTFYTVTVAGGMTGGTLSASPKSGEAGAEISLAVAADSGYRLKAGTLKYNNGTGDTPVDESTKKFNLPSYNVTVSAQFETLPGLIHSAEDLAKIGTPGYPLDGNYELTANITLPSGWMPIGSGTAPFTGTFDGKGYSITVSSFPSNGVDISAAPDLEDFSDMLNDHQNSSGGIIARGLFAYVKDAVIEDLDISVNPGSAFGITHTAAQQIQLFGTVAAAAVNTRLTNIRISGGMLDVNASTVYMLIMGGIAGMDAGKLHDRLHC